MAHPSAHAFSRREFALRSAASAGAIAGLAGGLAGARPAFARPARQARSRIQEFHFVIGNGSSTTNLPTLDVTTTGADLCILAALNYQMGLIYTGGDNQLYNGLAQDYSVSDDLLAYTFNLRPGLRWSDGSPFTSADVRYSWNRAAWPETKGNVGGMLNDIAGIDAVLNGDSRDISGVSTPDDNTVVVTLKAPASIFPLKMAHPWAWGWLKRDAYERDPDGYWQRPLANGPFQIDQWIQDDRLIFSRNPYFYGEPANLDAMHFLFNRDGSTLLTAYENNELDLVSVDSQDAVRFSAPGLPHYNELRAVPLGVLSLVFKEALPPMEDPLVRLAFYQAIDRGTIADKLFPGDFTGATSVHSPAFPWFNPAIQLPRFDPAAAKDALARSTYKSARNLPPIHVAGSSLDAFQRATVAMQQMWKDNLGIDVDVKLTEFPYEAASQRRQLGIGGRGYIFSDVSAIPASIWETEGAWNKASSGLLQEDGTLKGYHKNPAIDAVLAQANSTLDQQERVRLYWQVEQMVIKDVYNLPLWHRQLPALVKPWVMDYTPRLGFYDMFGARPSNVWIAEHR